MTAMLVLGVTTTSVANAEDVPNSVEVTSFPFELSVMENGQIIFNNIIPNNFTYTIVNI